VERVALLTATGREVEALEVGAAALSGVTGDTHAELCLRLARAAVSSGQWTVAVQFVERAGRPADPRSSILRAEAAFGAGNPGSAAVLAGSAVDLAEAAGQPEAICAALIVVGRYGEVTDPAVAARAFRRAAQEAAEHGLLPWRVQALFGLGRIELLRAGNPAALDEAGELAVDAGLLALALSIQMIQAELVMVVDGPNAAGAKARPVAEQAGQLGLTGIHAMSLLLTAAAAGTGGDLDSMRSQLATALALPHISMEVAAGAAAIRSLPALLAHDLGRADELLDSGFRSLTQHASAAPFAYWGMWALLRTAVADDSGPRDFLRSAPPGIRDINRGAVGYADAIAAGREGRATQAAELFAQADGALSKAHWWRRLLRTVVLDAAVRDGWGDPVSELRNDLAVYERDDEQELARISRDLLRLAGAPTRRGRGSGPVPADLRAKGVTSREVDVFDLLASGLSNAEIAQRLFLSTRTVETHVSSLLAKLDCADRAGLRRLAAHRTNSVARTDP
jgi:DNA-binding CsgD family transcriptional regulator